jgi:hypothetical protein
MCASYNQGRKICASYFPTTDLASWLVEFLMKNVLIALVHGNVMMMLGGRPGFGAVGDKLWVAASRMRVSVFSVLKALLLVRVSWVDHYFCG